jgi:hypothetical protein
MASDCPGCDLWLRAAGGHPLARVAPYIGDPLDLSVYLGRVVRERAGRWSTEERLTAIIRELRADMRALAQVCTCDDTDGPLCVGCFARSALQRTRP